MKRILLLMALVLTTPALAEERQCRQTIFSLTPPVFSLVRVHESAPHVYDGSKWQPSCPWDIVHCTSKTSYFRAGRLGLAAAFEKGLVCIVEIDQDNEGQSAWIEERHVTRLRQKSSQAMSDWTGIWSHFDDKITIYQNEKGLKVAGTAVWQGPTIDHFGDFSGISKPNGSHLAIKSGEACKVAMTLVGQFLVVADNQNCGGLNVIFRGIYSRVKRGSRPGR